MEVELRTVERAVALVDDEVLAHLGDRFLQDVLVALPLLDAADVAFGHGGQLDRVVQTEGRIHLVEQADDVLDLVLHLLGRHEDVRVVLREAAHAEQSAQSAGQLVAVHKTQLAAAKRQIAVGMRLACVDQHAARAVHRLDREIFVVDDRGVHVLLIVLPVTAAFPERTAQDDRGTYLDVAVTLMHFAPVIDERIAKHHALRQEEREARALVEQHKETEVLAELSVVALLRFLDAGDVRVEVRLLFECGRVDTLQHLVLLGAAPVRAGDAHELDVFNLAGTCDVRACAEVHKLALPIEADRLALGQIADKLDLVGLALLLHERDRFLTRELEALQFVVLVDDAVHFLLDLFEILGREGFRRVEVVIEAVCDRGTDGKLGFRVQALDRLRENVRAGVAIRPASVLVLPGQKLQFAVLFDRTERVRALAVDGAAQRCFPESVADRAGDVQRAHAVFKFPPGTVGKRNDHTDTSVFFLK